MTLSESSPDMVLVVGATGALGSEIVRLLSDSGRPVRAVVRKTTDPGKLERIANLPIETVHADLTIPATLDNACRGVTSVVSTATAIMFSFEMKKFQNAIK